MTNEHDTETLTSESVGALAKRPRVRLLPCPFCGRQPELGHPDTLYPTGSGWKQRDGFRSYHSRREVPPEQWCYGMHCDESCGGCGAEISADSADEAVSKWNRRPNAELAAGLRSDPVEPAASNFVRGE